MRSYKILTIVLLFAGVFSACVKKSEQAFTKGLPEAGPITLVVHGGAGTILKKNMTPEQEMSYKQKLTEALDAGYAVLRKGGTSNEAVIVAIKILEDSPLFNAGKGAVFTNEGKNELDASIMQGNDLNAGAVAGVTTIKNPITAAFEVMTNSPHVMLSGSGAENFAASRGIELVEPAYFYTARRFDQLQKIAGDSVHYKFGTVGAVALDKHGNITAATSTGGMTNKKFGRIGDSPIIGAGTYADNATCGVSATGHGEFFIRAAVAYDISARMKYKKLTLEAAASEAVMNRLEKMGGKGGVIALDRKGNISMPFNTSGMYRGYINKEGQAKVFIYKD